MDRYLVKIVRMRTECVRVKAKDKKDARSRVLRGIGKRISTAETNVHARVIKAL